MDIETVPTFELGDILATRCGNTLTGKFLTNSKIALIAYTHKNTNAFANCEQPSKDGVEDPVLIYIAQETTIYEEPLLRSLLSEANTTFNTLRKLGKNASKTEYINVSQAYRSIVRSCLEKLEQMKTTPKLQVDEAELRCSSEAITTFYAVECLWHLFEILYVQEQHNQMILAQLLKWTRFHFPQTEAHATDLLLMAEDASDRDDYWEILKTLIMLGEVSVTAAILTQNRKAGRDEFQEAISILKAMPVFEDGYALQKFRSQWEYWHVNGEHKLDANAFAAEPELELLMQLVVGKNEQWDEALCKSKEWYEYLPGYLLYTNPTCKPFDLRIAATAWLNRWSRLRPEWQMKTMSRMIKHLMAHDIKLFLFEMQQLNESNWFATHLIDLIYQSGQLNSYCEQRKIDLKSLRNSTVYNFGSFLMTSHKLWQLGIDYLDCCGEEGIAAINILLPRIPFKTERLALKLIAMARQRNLFEVEPEICKVLFKRSYDEERHGSALEWVIRSKDATVVTAMADFILKNYSKTGIFVCPDVITNIGARMFIAPRLVFLCKYFEFNELYRKRDFSSATKLLVNLLDSKITPSYFWPTLFIESIPLLESKEPMLTSKETVTILHHLETNLLPLIEQNMLETAIFPNLSSTVELKDYRIENVDEMVSVLRYACARNYSRTILKENTA